MPVFLTALAVSDTCLLYTGLLRLWVNHLFLLDLKALSRGWCKVLTWMTYSSVMVSAWVLMFMTVERSVSVWTPHKVSLLCSKFTAIVIVLLVTIGALLVNAHLLYGLDMVEKKLEGGGAAQESIGGGSHQSSQAALQNVTPGRDYYHYRDFQDTRLSGELMVPEECRSCRNLTANLSHGSLSSSQTILITVAYTRRTADADSSNGISLLGSSRHSAADKIDRLEVSNLHASSQRYYALNASSSWTLQKDDSPAITTASSAAGTSTGSASDDVADMECGMPDPRYKDFFDGEWTWLDLTLSSALPFLVLLSGNCLIVVKVRRQPQYWMATSESRRLGSMGSRDVARRRKTASSMTLILVTLSVVFFVTTLPVCVFNVTEIHILNAMGRDPSTMSKLDLAWVVVSLLMYSNSALNFYLYCLTGHKFRAEFLLLARGCLPCPAGRPRSLASTRAAAAAATSVPRPHAADHKGTVVAAARVSKAGVLNGRCCDGRSPSVFERQKTIGYDQRAHSVALHLEHPNESLQRMQEGGTVPVLGIARLASPECDLYASFRS